MLTGVRFLLWIVLGRSLESETVRRMNEIRSPAPSLPELRAAEELTAVAQAHAQAMADAQSFGAPFDFWAHLEPGWDFWSVGKSASVTGDLSDPKLPCCIQRSAVGRGGVHGFRRARCARIWPPASPWPTGRHTPRW